jgi:hypothetical protein
MLGLNLSLVVILISPLHLHASELKSFTDIKEGVFTNDSDIHYIYVKGKRTCILIPHYGGYTVRDLGTVMESANKGFLKDLKKQKDIASKDYENPKILDCLNSKKTYVEAYDGEWDANKKTK